MTGRVLVVDDKPNNRGVMREILTGVGFDVVLAVDDSQAFTALQNPVDLILMDVMLGQTDGFLVARRIKQMPDYQHIPILFISALDGVEEQVRGYDSGGLGYIPRMVDPRIIVAMVKRFVALSQSMRG